jgi:hypothetical protein
MTHPELIILAAAAAGVSPDEAASAIKCALDLLSAKPTRAERTEIYATWLDPISRPLAESMDLPIDEVHRALVASLQQVDPARARVGARELLFPFPPLPSSPRVPDPSGARGDEIPERRR